MHEFVESAGPSLHSRPFAEGSSLGVGTCVQRWQAAATTSICVSSASTMRGLQYKSRTQRGPASGA
jgi:hypothetical protein